MKQNRDLWGLTAEGAEMDRLAVGRPELAPSHALTLSNLFQIVTGCCLFFVCMRFSPLLAIGLTLFATPAVIRTGLVSRRFRESGQDFIWPQRALAFGQSLLIVWMTLALALVTFVLISITFGLICVLVTSATPSASDLMRDVGFIGTLGGTIWGGAGAIMSLSLSQKLWILPRPMEPGDR